MKRLEVILDPTPSGGCGCNCGCGGASVLDDINELVENLKEHKFETDIEIDMLDITGLDADVLIEKINSLLDNTNAQFRVDQENLDEALKNILPLVALDGTILTAYGVPTFYDVVIEVEKHL